MRDFLKQHPRYGNPLHHPPHRVAGTAANLVYEVAPMITLSRARRLRDAMVKAAVHTKDLIATTPERAMTAWSVLRSEETRERLAHDYELVRDLVAGKVKERFGPLMKTLASRAAPADHDPQTQPAAFTRAKTGPGTVRTASA